MDSNRSSDLSRDRSDASLEPRGKAKTGITRRRVLHSSTAVGAFTAFAGCLDDDSNAGQDGEGQGNEQNGSDASPPFETRTIDARGSESGVISIPEDGTVLVVNFARTQCPTSEGQISDISDATDEGGADSARFMTVNDWTRGPADTDDELAEWWETETDGDWLIGIDEDGEAADYYDVVSFPKTIVFDEDGEITWSYSGESGSSRLLGAIDDAEDDSA